MTPVYRPAQKSDYSALSRFTNASTYLHRHLDWRDSLEWLDRRPFWIMEEDGEMAATLACPAEPEEVAWVRLFAASMRTSPDRAWRKLFDLALQDLNRLPQKPTITSLALRDWFEDLLKRQGFSYHQDIVVFVFDGEPPQAASSLLPGYRLREMKMNDLAQVEMIDHLAFETIWQLSTDDLRFAARKSSYCTVVEVEGKIIAYQMSSNSGMYAHLARLAVDPALQGRRIGFALVQDLLDHFINQSNYLGVTLNTQHNNTASIALYHKVGFRETGERFPVLVYS